MSLNKCTFGFPQGLLVEGAKEGELVIIAPEAAETGKEVRAEAGPVASLED
jgi:hypothetical protein